MHLAAIGQHTEAHHMLLDHIRALADGELTADVKEEIAVEPSGRYPQRHAGQ